MAQFIRQTLEQSLQSGSVSVGRYTRVESVTTSAIFTGSLAGGSAVLVGTGVTAGNVNLIGGGTINAAHFVGTGIPIECQPSSIDSVANGTVYVLYGASR